MRDRFWQIGLRVVLILSLLGNGAALGAYWRHKSAVEERQAERVRMPQEIRQAYRRAIRNTPEVSQAFRALRAARRDVLALQAADPVDPDALAAALAAVREASAALQAAGHPLLLDAMLDHAESEGRLD